jgi:membrane protein YqaA with SNARE-associated domain
MDTEKLSQYVVDRIRAGAGKTEVKDELIAIGWTEDEAEAAFRAGVVALGAPLPTEGNRPTLSKKASTVDVVINFFSFILLGIVATALGTLYFQIINLSFPDALDAMNYYSLAGATSTIHYSIAALLIGFPLYYFAMRIWFRKFREDEGRTESKLSKWLTYLVLLVAAVTIVGDLITTLFTLLQGEITARFFLKAIVILGIAGAVFGFYYLERKKIQYRTDIPRRTFQLFGRGVSAVALVGIILGFMVGGSPTTERNRSFDETRASYLSSLANCVEQYASSLGALPTALADLTMSSQYSYCDSYMKDPETGLPYEYRVVTPSMAQGAGRVGQFELCANFALASDATTPRTGYGLSGVWYEHSVGRSCDTVSAQLLVPINPAAVIPTTPAVKSGVGTACTMEAKLCPDGTTSVSRQGPNCEFAPCPTAAAPTAPIAQ